MLARFLDSLALVLLWVCSLVMVIALAGMVIAIIPLGWAPLFLYGCVGLYCAWSLYRKTVFPNGKPVSQLLGLQCLFVMLVSALCSVLGLFEWFGFSHHESQVAGLPLILFALLFIRRAILANDEPKSMRGNPISIVLLTIAYVLMAIAIAYVAAGLIGVFMTDMFEGVSLMISPFNWVSWLVIYLWFLPAFLVRALGRKMRGTVNEY